MASSLVAEEPLLPAPEHDHGRSTAGSAAAAGRAAAPLASGRHGAALLRKNTILKRRQWSATCCPLCPLAACCELVLPLLVLVLLWWAKSECLKGDQCNIPVRAGWGGQMPKSNHSTECVEGLPLDPHRPSGFSHCEAWTQKRNTALPFHEVLAYLHWSGKRLALAVHNPADIPKVEAMRDFIAEQWYPATWYANIPCKNLEHPVFSLSQIEEGAAFHNVNKTRLPCEGHGLLPLDLPHPGWLPSFANLTHPTILTKYDLDEYVSSPDYGDKGLLYGAVVFSSIGGDGSLGAPGHWSYTIRLNATSQTTVPTLGEMKTRPLVMGLNMREAWTYLNKGFVSIQLMLDRYIIGSRYDDGDTDKLLEANRIELSMVDTAQTRNQVAEPLRYLPQSLDTVPMPVDGVLIDGFYQLVAAFFPLLFIVAFMYTQKTIINELITEKETKVRESLRMLGVSSFSIFGSWYATYGTIFVVICGVFALVAGLEIFPSSSGTLVFSFYWLWSMSFLAFAVFVHAWFNQARTGGIVGVILMFVQWVVYASQNRPESPASPLAMRAMMIMPNAAFCAGLDMLSKYEASKVGANWHNLHLEVVNSTFGTVLIMLTVDIVFWSLLGWYLDRVLPKEYGARLPVNFLCMNSYWFRGGEARAPHIVWPDDRDDVPARGVGENTVEPVPEALRLRSQASGVLVRTRGLRREFPTPGGVKVAVAGLDLTMYEGQVLACLGHNGAGKTTTINMLTGMVAPSAGDAEVAGLSIRTEMHKVRRIIGVCPQHDVLWFELTVLEHLLTYARLRNVAEANVRQRAQAQLREVGLTEKAHTRAGSLSGGQKRKLSLCLALIGDPRVVFLDEPTSGMDPFSRRFTWDMIRSVREGRVTVLTTHFMDEADILGDRIAIIADGVLQCCGSALFLKNRFGAGYKLTCARKKASSAKQPAQGSREAGAMPSCEALDDAIRRHVPEMEVLTDVGSELSVRLPVSAASKFPNMLEELDGGLDKFGLEHYGLSMVTLEEVFLRIASGGIEEMEASSSQPKAPLDATVRPGRQDVELLATSETDTTALASGSYLSLSDESAPPATPPDNACHKEAAVTFRHLSCMFLKRVRYGRRDAKSMVCMVLLPVAWLAFGLGLLQYFNQRYMPPVDLSMVSQYGWNSKVGFNFTGQNGAWANATMVNDAVGVAVFQEDVPRELGHGMAFGRNYSVGLPVYTPCEEHQLPLGKCWRQRNLCSRIWDGVQMMRMVGFDIDCHTDSRSCQAVIQSECGNNQARCIRQCQARDKRFTHEVCQKQCREVCDQAGQMEWVCNLLWDPFHGKSNTIAWVCPHACASAVNPDTCSPGSTCNRPEEEHYFNDPEGILAFSRLLFDQGQGTPLEDAHYGAVKADEVLGVGNVVTLLYNTSAYHIVPSLLNMVSGSLKVALSGKDSSISVTNEPMPIAYGGDVDRIMDAVINLFSAICVINAFSFIPAGVVAYIVREREATHNSKHQQLISGVSLVAYWLANIVWDLVVYVAPLSLSLLIIHLMGIQALTDHGAFLATLKLFVGYGLSIIPLTYLVSFLFHKHTTAQVICLVANFITGLLMVLVSYILSVIDATKDVNEILMWFFRIFPGFSLGHGLLQITTNSVIAGLIGGEVDLTGWDVAGKDLLYLFCTAPVYFVLCILLDYVLHSPLSALSKHFDPSAVVGEEDDEDEDVHAEALRVARGEAKNDMLCLQNLRKVYRTPEGVPKLAVRNLSFGLPRGECFGFLGINGAGKTSTLNMLTGAVLPSSGQAYLSGFDVVKEQWKVRRLIGYCPQHDALLDRLTVWEHLRLFGRIKGIPSRALEDYCINMMHKLTLDPHGHKLSMTLSGGNKRKLSLAIAMMGTPAPPMVFLDEPSTGVDPAARRQMWHVIEAATMAGRGVSTVVLTTHNMEEAEALCTTIGIMVGGRLRCFGSNQRLKARYSHGYQLEARLRCIGADTIKKFVSGYELPATLDYDGLVRFCQDRGEPQRLTWLQPGCVEGHLVMDALSQSNSVAAVVVAEWWILADLTNQLTEFLHNNFPGTQTLERHDRTLRFRLAGECAIAHVFRILETHQSKLALEEYGLSQTSLEQIFNEFASQQQEEKAAAPGLVATSGNAGPFELQETAAASSAGRAAA